MPLFSHPYSTMWALCAKSCLIFTNHDLILAEPKVPKPSPNHATIFAQLQSSILRQFSTLSTLTLNWWWYYFNHQPPFPFSFSIASNYTLHKFPPFASLTLRMSSILLKILASNYSKILCSAKFINIKVYILLNNLVRSWTKKLFIIQLTTFSWLYKKIIHFTFNSCLAKTNTLSK